VSRNIFRMCKIGIETGGQLCDISIKQDVFHLGGGRGLEIRHKIAGRSCLICGHAPVTAAKLREKA